MAAIATEVAIKLVLGKHEVERQVDGTVVGPVDVGNCPSCPRPPCRLWGLVGGLSSRVSLTVEDRLVVMVSTGRMSVLNRHGEVWVEPQTLRRFAPPILR